MKLNTIKWILLITTSLVLVISWLGLIISVFYSNDNGNSNISKTIPLQYIDTTSISSSLLEEKNNNPIKHIDDIKLPQRIKKSEPYEASPPLSEVQRNLTLYLNTLHSKLGALAGPKVTAEEIWETFLEVTRSMVMKWDTENRNKFEKPRNDDSIYVALGTYRDPYCPMTIKSLYANAKNPQKVFVGLFQQNCFEKKCRTGVLKGGIVNDMDTDVNCYTEFCSSSEGINSNACNNGNVRLFNVNESESLGPYMARYLGAKFYRGEEFYLQIDSHSEFVKDWDAKLIKMVRDAPAEKPVISAYPPSESSNWRDSIGYRICDSEFADAQIEWQIIRLGTGQAFDNRFYDVPRYAPFVAAGFFFGPATLLHEVPFDPLLPWIFMGEEISMSARLWTAGYDIFSPTINVLNHYYVRRHYPKFWESVNRFFKKGIHNSIVELIIERVKNNLGYPESRADRVQPASLLYRLNDWGMGNKRSYAAYLEMVGIEPISKTITPNTWCHKGLHPPQALPYKKDKI